MAQYPSSLTQRFGDVMKALQRRVTKLETRTAGIDSGFPLAALPARVDPSYASGDPMAFINGSTTLTGPYQCLASYTPAAGDSVIVLPVGALTTYVILGKPQ